MTQTVSVSLSVVDRLTILNATLPAQGSMLAMTMAGHIRERLVLTPRELEALGVRPGADQIAQPDFDKVGEVAFEFTAGEITLIGQALRDLDKQQKLTAAHIPLYGKFVREEEQATEKADA